MRKHNCQTRTLNHIQNFSIEMPAKRVIKKIMDKGQENPFISQFYSILVSRRIDENLLDAPLNFIVCLDIYKVKRVFEIKNVEYSPSLTTLLLPGLIDSIMAAQSIVLAANDLDLGTCYLSHSLKQVKLIRKRWNLPHFVVPFTTIAAGYPDEPSVIHHNFPSNFIYFEDEYTPADDFGIHDLMYKLDNDEELLEYYKRLIDDQSQSTKQFSDWLELLLFNCQMWNNRKKELALILKECGIDLKLS